MQLKLKRNKATFLELRDANEDEALTEGFDLQHRTLFSPDKRDSFAIEFKLGITVDKTHRLTVQYASEFETDSEFDSEFEKSSFARINAPAIAFPFIRSYVAHITLIAGFETVIIPSVNFTLRPDDIRPYEKSE